MNDARDLNGSTAGSSGFDYGTAYLDGAAAAFAELAAQRSDLIGGFDAWSPRSTRPVSAAFDLEAAESAIALLREDRDRRGYTDEDAATARALRGVLDAAQVWDTVTSTVPIDLPVPLEPELQPDRVRSRPGWDDIVVLEAGFAGATVIVQRTAHASRPADYEFLASGPTGPNRLRDVDTTGMGIIAAGDRSLRPTRAGVYDALGEQIREHLVGLAEAVADYRDSLNTMESGRSTAAQITPANPTRPGHDRSL